MSLIITAP